jgi:hypothetical protein
MSPWWLLLPLVGAAFAGWMAAQTSEVLPRVLWIALLVTLAAGALAGWRRR